ncbi:putative small heat shock protein HSP20 [Dioscorea sansibarensis]
MMRVFAALFWNCVDGRGEFWDPHGQLWKPRPRWPWALYKFSAEGTRREHWVVFDRARGKRQRFFLYSSLSTLSVKMSIIRRGSVFDPFSLDVWDPFGSFPNFFNDALSVPRSDFVSDTTAFANTRIDWKETPEAHVFKADLPGLKKEEVKVEVEEGRVLQISGERSKEQDEKNDKWHRVERSSGKFLRRFRLPDNAKVDQVKAAMENGVLTVTVPKEEVKKPETKSIEISG